MSWIYERPNEYICLLFCLSVCLSVCLSFILKKFVKNPTNFHITYYSGLIKAILKLFGSRTSICKAFFIMDPNLMSHQFSAQPTRKDKTNPKINDTKSIKK